MRLAKPILLAVTPLGVAGGLHEAWKFSPGLAFLMGAMVMVMGAAVGGIVLTVRREQAEEAARLAAAGDEDEDGDGNGEPGPPR